MSPNGKERLTIFVSQVTNFSSTSFDDLQPGKTELSPNVWMAAWENLKRTLKTPAAPPPRAVCEALSNAGFLTLPP